MQYKLKCPECGYSYTVELLERYEYESCPVCGHNGKFESFIDNHDSVTS